MIQLICFQTPLPLRSKILFHNFPNRHKSPLEYPSAGKVLVAQREDRSDLRFHEPQLLCTLDSCSVFLKPAQFVFEILQQSCTDFDDLSETTDPSQ